MDQQFGMGNGQVSVCGVWGRGERVSRVEVNFGFVKLQLKELRKKFGQFFEGGLVIQEEVGSQNGGGSRDREGGRVRGDLWVKLVGFVEWLNVGCWEGVEDLGIFFRRMVWGFIGVKRGEK